METLLAVLTTLNAMTPLGVIALLATIIYLQVKSHKQVDTLKTNDLHELPEVVESLRRIEILLASEFSYIRAKLNGKP